MTQNYRDTFAETMNLIMEHYALTPSRIILEPNPIKENRVQFVVRCRRAECLASISACSLAYFITEEHMLKERLLVVQEEIRKYEARVKKASPLRKQVNLKCKHRDCNATITEENPRHIREDGLQGCEECHAQREQAFDNECPGCDYYHPPGDDLCYPSPDPDEDEEPVTLGQAFEALVGIK